MKTVKTYLKEKSDSGTIPSLSELIKMTKNYSYISFDVFDTLLKRNVNNPSDIFDLVQLRVGKEEANFKKKRIDAELSARKNNNAAEITLNDIYQNYDANDYVRSKLKKLELEIEKQCLTVNHYIIDFFNYCVKYKNVYIISDMYLPSEFVESVLTDNKIIGYKKLYVSCDYGKTKHNGSLFDLYLSQNGINPINAIHIGDSWRSDYVVPKKKGISALHIPRILKNNEIIFNGSQINTTYLNSFVNNQVELNKNSYYKFGYQKFGPFLWGYVRWLRHELISRHISTVYFFSRDGYIMKKAFDFLYANDKIESHYLEVSRRSLRIPILHFDHTFKTILSMVSPSKMIPLVSLFDCVGLDINNYSELLIKYGFKANDSFDRSSISDNAKLISMYNELSEDITEKSDLEFDQLVRYLKQENVKGKFGIVDIGWSGGMQRFLTETLDKLKVENEIHGFYIGVADYYTRNTNKMPGLDLNGYLFDFKNDTRAVDKRSSFVGLFESLFLEQAGSVKNYSYSSKKGKIVANRSPYEYIINGEKTYELKDVHEIQNGALDFIKDAKKDDLLANTLTFSADELFQGIIQTGQNPHKKDLDMFSNFRFFDEGKICKLASPRNIAYYMQNPQKLKHDFLLSRWKIGFMKKLFKIDMPYQKMYQWMLRYK